MQGYVRLNNWFIVFNQSYPILECQCNPDGSTTLECNDNGDCSCKDEYVGQKCDGKIFLKIHDISQFLTAAFSYRFGR